MLAFFAPIKIEGVRDQGIINTGVLIVNKNKFNGRFIFGDNCENVGDGLIIVDRPRTLDLRKGHLFVTKVDSDVIDVN